MKYLYLLIATNLLTVSILSAQNTPFETTIRSSFFSYGQYIFAMDNEENIIVGKDYISGGWGNEMLRLDKVDASGNLLWSNTYPALTPGEAYHFMDAVKGSDNSFFITGNQGGCDYFEYDDIMKFDANGNLLWTKIVTSLGVPFIGSIRASSNGGLWVNDFAGGLIELDNNGNVAQTMSVNLDYITNYDCNTSTGDLLVWGTSNGNRKLRYIEAGGNSYEISMSSTQGQPKFLDNNMLAFLGDDALKLYDNQLNLTDSLASSALPNDYDEVLSDDQYIYLTDLPWNQPSNLLKLDYNLNILDELTFPFRTNDIDVKDDYIKLVGQEYQHTWMKNVNSNFNDTYADTDIGVVNILVNAADSICYGQYYNYCNCNFEAEGIKVVVENFGTEVVDYFEVNALYDECYFICYDAQATKMTYDNRTLMPGQLDTVDFPDLNLYGINDYSYLCLYTTRPNQLTDKDHENDNICRNFFYNDITSVNEAGASDPLIVFPNPTTGIFNIKGIAEGEYSIFNTAGQMLQTGQLEHNISIDISAFPQGVYFISVMVNDEQVVRRLVKM